MVREREGPDGCRSLGNVAKWRDKVVMGSTPTFHSDIDSEIRDMVQQRVEKIEFRTQDAMLVV